MTNTQTVARLISNAFAFTGRASTQLEGGSPTAARHLLARASRDLTQAQHAAPFTPGYFGSAPIIDTARTRIDAARALIGAGNLPASSDAIASTKFGFDLLLPG